MADYNTLTILKKIEDGNMLSVNCQMSHKCNCQLSILDGDSIRTRKHIVAGASIIIVNYPIQTPIGEIKVPTILVGKERFGPNAGRLNLPCGRRERFDCCGYGAATRETLEELKIEISGKNRCFIHRGSFIIVTSANYADVNLDSINELISTDYKNENLGPEQKEMRECDFIVIHTEETIGKFVSNVNLIPTDKKDPQLGTFIKFACNFLRKKENWKKYVEPLLQ